MCKRLYIHVPFCLKKCLYCAFVSQPPEAGELDRYAALLLSEADMRLKECDPVESIYFGGGTPSLLKPQQLAALLTVIERSSGIAANAEITLEMNPGTADPTVIEAFRASGINRLSLGVQSFDESFLGLLGRVHTGEQSLRAFHAARAAGFDNISIDLIHALPQQTLEQWHYELACAVQLAPEHLSIYGLTIEEGTPFASTYHPENPALAGEDLAADMFEAAHTCLAAAGYDHYEIANYARPGRRSRHNSGYWRRDEYLGLGIAAHSFLRDGYGCRFSNPTKLAEYQQAVTTGTFLRLDEQQLSQQDAMAEYLFLGLRLAEGIELAAFAAEFGCSCHDLYGAQLADLGAAGLLLEQDGRIMLTLTGMLLSNQVFMKFLQ